MTVRPASQRRIGGHGVCPWWVAYLFDNPLRRMIHPASKVLGAYVSPGMTTLDFGCGFGHYTLGMARLVGAGGKVLAVDLQDKMLNMTMSRARKGGLGDIIVPVRCDARRIGVTEDLDFALACNSIHEAAHAEGTLRELFAALKPEGRFLLMEPRSHIKDAEFEEELAIAGEIGFEKIDSPCVFKQRTALLRKPR